MLPVLIPDSLTTPSSGSFCALLFPYGTDSDIPFDSFFTKLALLFNSGWFASTFFPALSA